MRHAIVTLALVAFVGCVTTERQTETSSVPTTSAEVPIGPPRAAATCRVTATDTVACDEAEAEVVAERVRGTVEDCRGGSAGKLTIHARTVDGKPVFDVFPDSSLNPVERNCVLNGLNEVYGKENTTLSTGGAGIPPSGFTSHVTIQWDLP